MSSELFPHCQICPIIENPSQQEIDFRIYEGEAWRVTLRENQALLGTSFVTLKEHKEHLNHLTREEDEELRVVRNALFVAVSEAFNPEIENFPFLMNDAFQRPPDAGPNWRPQPHVHAHYKPRYAEERTVEGIEGQVFTDPEFGHYLRIPRTQAIGHSAGKIIVAKIKEHFTIRP